MWIQTIRLGMQASTSPSSILYFFFKRQRICEVKIIVVGSVLLFFQLVFDFVVNRAYFYCDLQTTSLQKVKNISHEKNKMKFYDGFHN